MVQIQTLLEYLEMEQIFKPQPKAAREERVVRPRAVRPRAVRPRAVRVLKPRAVRGTKADRKGRRQMQFTQK
jgi:hypothetical protein